MFSYIHVPTNNCDSLQKQDTYGHIYQLFKLPSTHKFYAIMLLQCNFSTATDLQICIPFRYDLLCEGCGLCTHSLVMQTKSKLHKRVSYYEYIRVLQLYYVSSTLYLTPCTLYTHWLLHFLTENIHSYVYIKVLLYTRIKTEGVEVHLLESLNYMAKSWLYRFKISATIPYILEAYFNIIGPQLISKGEFTGIALTLLYTQQRAYIIYNCIMGRYSMLQ